jgi:hypothetical protein
MSVRIGLLGTVLLLVGTACASSSSSGGSQASTCASQGYLPTADAGACPMGLCVTSVGPLECCGSLCTSCEAKGLTSYTEAGVCPPGTCPSADVTLSLACCAPLAANETPCSDQEAEAGAATDASADVLGDGPVDSAVGVAADP